MITEKDIARINELYHKSKSEGLTEPEKQEQAKLRRAYIDAIKGNVRPNEYYWVEFTPTMNKIKGNIVEKHGGKEVKKTYVEIVYPDAEESNKKDIEFKTSTEKPAEKLS